MVFCCRADDVRVHWGYFQVIYFLVSDNLPSGTYIAMSCKRGHNLLLSRINDLDHSDPSSDSQQRIPCRLITSPGTNTQLLIDLNSAQSSNALYILVDIRRQHLYPIRPVRFRYNDLQSVLTSACEYISSSDDGKHILATAVFVECDTKQRRLNRLLALSAREARDTVRARLP